MLQRHKGYIFIALAVIELSFLPILSSIGASKLGTIPLLFLTFLTASAVSFALLYAKKRIGALLNILADKEAMVVIIAAGLLNYAASQLFLTMGTLGTGPIVTSLILKLWPIFMALMLPFTLRTRVRKTQLTALALGFLGIYILVTQGTLSLPGNLGITIFIVFTVISTMATAMSNVIIRSHNYDIYAQVFLFNASSLALFAGLAMPGIWAGQFTHIDTSSIISFLFLGSITYSIGAIMFFYALKTLNPVFVGNATYATPFLTILFSVILVGSQVHGYYFVALAFIFAALFVQQRSSNKALKYIPSKGQKWPYALFDITGVFVSNKGTYIPNSIRGKGRALATIVDKDAYKSIYAKSLSGADIIMFTNNKLHPDVSSEELEFMESIMAPKGNELILVGIGNPEKIEDTFSRMYYASGSAPQMPR
ncbi:MAG: DMT family transporter [Candidatus Micrarchaeota archaeon]|nr:DMT family transporter [Candidatus Micrarchaeota archaeon]